MSDMAKAMATQLANIEKPNSMCPYKVKLTSADEVDATLVAWIRRAFDGAA